MCRKNSCLFDFSLTRVAGQIRQLMVAAILCLVAYFAGAAPSDCMGDAPDGKMICTLPIIDDLYSRGICIQNNNYPTSSCENQCGGGV